MVCFFSPPLPFLCVSIYPLTLGGGKQQFDDEAYYCDYSSRVSGACTAVWECGGGKVKQGTCFQGKYVKEVFRRVHAGGFQYVLFFFAFFSFRCPFGGGEGKMRKGFC